MKPTVAFIHTIHGIKDDFDRLGRECLPDCGIFHVADDSLIQRLLAAGGLTSGVWRRVCEHVTGAAEAGADYIQFTCSSISPCADAAATLVDVPVLTIDEPMVRMAVSRHQRIGVIATNPATLKPSVELVAAIARELGREVQVQSSLCEGAYDALFAGDREAHDRIVLDSLAALLDGVDAVCLAQASMARIGEMLPEAQRRTPVYSSPRPAMVRLGELMRGAEAENG